MQSEIMKTNKRISDKEMTYSFFSTMATFRQSIRPINLNMQDSKQVMTFYNLKSKKEVKYDNTSRDINYAEIKEKLMNFYQEGTKQLDCEFPGIQIFDVKRSNPTFYNILNKRYQKYVKALEYNEMDLKIWTQGLAGPFIGLRNLIYHLVQTPSFDSFIIFMVSLNTIFMIIDDDIKISYQYE